MSLIFKHLREVLYNCGIFLTYPLIFFSSCLTDHTHSSVRNRPLVSQHTVCQYQNVGYSPLRIVSCFFVILSIFTSSSLVHFSIPAVYLTAATTHVLIALVRFPAFSSLLSILTSLCLWAHSLHTKSFL